MSPPDARARGSRQTVRGSGSRRAVRPDSARARRRPGAVLDETLRGIAGSGQAHLDYLYYLFLQAVVLFIWWPKDSLHQTLVSGQAPDTLLAATVALGFATAWHAARAGAGELLLPEQAPLVEWVAGTALPLRRILWGVIAGHLVQTATLVALSMPLLLCAFGVSGGRWGALAGCLAGVVFQALAFRFAGTAIHLAIGQHPTMTLICVRAMVVLGYLAAMMLPVASHVRLSSSLLVGTGDPQAALQPTLAFVISVSLLTAMLLALVAHQLRGLRQRAAQVTG